MARQLAKVTTDRGEYIVVYDDREFYNKFKVYLRGYRKDGKYHKTCEDMFRDYFSAMDYILNWIER